MKIIVKDDYSGLSCSAAEYAAEYINKTPGALLCLAAGDTPHGMFRELIAMQQRREVDLSSVWYVQLDEWVGLGANDTGSCAQVMNDSFYKPANIPPERIHTFNGLDNDTEYQCREMERFISARGGIGLTVLGVGMNGHIGFNEPGTPDIEGCFTVALDNVTKSVGSKYFGKPTPVDTGITIGWRTLFNAEKVILLASGEKKAPIIKSALYGPSTAKLPASLLQAHKDLTVILDKDAS